MQERNKRRLEIPVVAFAIMDARFKYEIILLIIEVVVVCFMYLNHVNS